MRKKFISKKDKPNLKKELSAALEIPGEVILDMPLISLKGREEISVENYRGIIEYSTEKIRLNTTAVIFKITGENLLIKCLDCDNVIITGKINATEFL